MYDGIEIDVLSLGDADCIVVTKWESSFPHRVLIDGGSGADAEIVIDFLRSRGYTNLWAALCTHPHNDHARGLIKVVQNRSFTIHNGWMHDIRRHVRADALLRASADDCVKEVVETTKELANAFASRRIVPQEPFSDSCIAGWPYMTVLGPSLPYYNTVIEEFTDANPASPSWLALASALGAGMPRPVSALAGLTPPPRYSALSSFLPPSQSPSNFALPLGSYMGLLSNSSVKKNPTTQTFNNTSVILGIKFNEQRLILTADAGSEALGRVPAEWNHLLYMGVPHHGSDGNLSQMDIERFCPEFAVVSARGDSSHPSRAIVSGLVKVGARVCSTHKSGNLRFWCGRVPYRADYEPAEPLKGTGEPEPVLDWIRVLSGTK